MSQGAWTVLYWGATTLSIANMFIAMNNHRNARRNLELSKELGETLERIAKAVAAAGGV